MARPGRIFKNQWIESDHFWTALAVTLLAACGQGSAQDSAVGSYPVVGGTTVSGECAWPSTVQVNAATGCTGTLIHPRIVTTAAHCLPSGGGTGRITFGSGQKRFTVTGTCKAGAMGESGVSSGRDWGYCVLPDDARIRALPTIPPLAGCEAEKFLKAGGNAWIVGFGATGADGAGFGTLRQVEVKINRVNASVLDVGDAQRGACHGDSGGPLYVQLKDGNRDYGWRIAGTTSGPGGPCDCTCSSVYVNIGMHVAAIEKNEGLDVTPCTDSSGAWAPGSDCKDMQKDPQNATGAFPNCVVARTSDAIESCGSAGVSGGSGGSASSGGASSGGASSGGASSGGASSGAGGATLGGRDGAGGGGGKAASSGGRNNLAGGTSGVGGNNNAGNNGGGAGTNAAGGNSAAGGNANTNGGSVSGGSGGNNSSGGNVSVGSNTSTGGSVSAAGNLGVGGANGSAAGGVTLAGGATAAVTGGRDSSSAGQAARGGAVGTSGGAEPGCSCVVGREPRSHASFGMSAALAFAFSAYRRRQGRHARKNSTATRQSTSDG